MCIVSGGGSSPHFSLVYLSALRRQRAPRHEGTQDKYSTRPFQNLPNMFLATQLAQDAMESTEESGENGGMSEEESSILQPIASKPWQLLQPRSRGWASRESNSAMAQPYSIDFNCFNCLISFAKSRPVTVGICSIVGTCSISWDSRKEEL